MIFSDRTLQEHYEKVAAAITGCPADQLPIFGLFDAYQYFSITEGEDSTAVREALDHLLSAELRPALREWYQRYGSDMNPNALAFRDRLGVLAGEKFG